MAGNAGRGAVVAELVPIADRIRWVLGCRALLVVGLFGVWVSRGGTEHGVPVPLWAAVGWLGLSALPVVRGLARYIAVPGFTAGLLGDGLLLALMWYRFGGLDGPVGYLVVLHGVAVTLLASFRTGAKLALWHTLLALMVVEAVAVGKLARGPFAAVSSARLTLYLVILWVAVLATASFAAVNERELRRRRYDSEVLRAFGVALAEEQDPVAVARRLAGFAHDELLAGRALVLLRAGEGAVPVAVLVEESAAVDVHRLTEWVTPDGVLARALAARSTALVARLDPAADGWLSAILPGARNLVVVPFVLDQVTGALVVEHPSGSSQRRSQRVERRMVSTAEQAVGHAALALGRTVLVERIKAQAQADGLTGVANRRRFDEGIAEAVAAGLPFALAIIDLDHFKAINDRHGHQAGDDVLRAAARAVADTCRDGDLLARYGGEEFAVILDGGHAGTGDREPWCRGLRCSQPGRDGPDRGRGRRAVRGEAGRPGPGRGVRWRGCAGGRLTGRTSP